MMILIYRSFYLSKKNKKKLPAFNAAIGDYYHWMLSIKLVFTKISGHLYDLTASFHKESSLNPSRPKKILTIDDDEDIRSSINQRLEMEGFQTIWAKNGRVALDYLNAMSLSELPDLILLDYMMPIMNGQEFCRQKSLTPRLAHIPVVMMTASGNLVNVMDKIDSRAEAYMSKPMDDETFVGMVKYFLEGMPESSSELTESIGPNPQMMNKPSRANIQTI